MKINKRYECEICGNKYDSEALAKKCESYTMKEPNLSTITIVMGSIREEREVLSWHIAPYKEEINSEKEFQLAKDANENIEFTSGNHTWRASLHADFSKRYAWNWVEPKYIEEAKTRGPI
jgi:hypothetical protein